MDIHPFVCGVIATILTEMAIVIIAAISIGNERK